MCMIIVKPKGVDFPDKELLEKAFRKNPDGAGFACNNDFIAKSDYIRIYKGFMDFDSFYNNISYFKKVYEDAPEMLTNKTFVFHFRKATKGEISPRLTQPFPITYQMDELIDIDCHAEYAFCHKGTFDFLKNRTTKGRGVSDTYIFVQEYLSLLALNKDWDDKWHNIQLLENLIDEKACMLKSDGTFKLFGEFFEHDGLLISEKIK